MACIKSKIIIKMMWQASNNRENPNQSFEPQQLIQQILKGRHHQNMINYRHFLTFEQFYTNYFRPTHQHRPFVRDVLAYSQSQEHLLKKYSMEEVTCIIRHVVLNRVKRDAIAPILANNPKQNGFISKVQRRYRMGAFQMRQSNTTNTEQSEKKTKFKYTQIQKILVSCEKPATKDSFNKMQDFSSQILGKAAQDLSKMIQNVYIPEQKKVNLQIKIPKYVQPKNAPHKTKQFKKFLTESNISIIRSPRKQNDFNQNVLNYDDPEQNYGLKKFKKNTKHKPNRMQQKTKSICLSESHKQFSQTKKKQGNICLSPLTPKPVSISKNKWGWEDALNKCSRYSIKTRVSSSNEKKISSSKLPKIPKSPPAKTKAPKIPKSQATRQNYQ